MKDLCLLSQLKEGECAEVRSINLSGSMRCRLQDLGLICGTAVKCIFRNPKGNTIAYCVRGAVIALRKSDCDKISVKCIRDKGW